MMLEVLLLRPKLLTFLEVAGQILHLVACPSDSLVLKQRIDCVEYLIGYEGNEFSSTGDIEHDLLSITAVHPLREDAVGNLLSHAQTKWDVVNKLIEKNLIAKEEYEGRTFYLRKTH